MPTTLYIDCFSGASGDMILGGLLDLGLPLDDLRGALGSLAVDAGEVSSRRVLRAGIAATKFDVAADRPDGHHHHPHYDLEAIVSAIRRSALGPAARDRATDLFERLARTEAEIHGMPVERVHLHEVGAIDSIVDIVGAVYGFDQLGAATIVSSPLNVGGGTVTCAHGVFPVPAPATARLLQGVPVYAGDLQMELVTPTGALLVTGYADSYGPMPPMTIGRIGYGAGSRNPKGHPNVLRMIVGDAAAAGHVHRVVEILCEIDDMNPQLFGTLMDGLLAAGALDVFYAPVQMKKNRPGTLVTVLARPEDRDRLAGILFAETTTIGVRYQEMVRECLDRELVDIDTPVGTVRFKVARRGGRILNASPEFDDCARIAAERQLPVKQVQAVALKAWMER